MLCAQPANERLVHLELSEIRDRRGQARAIHKMAGGMSISAGPALIEREINHCPEQQSRRQRMLPSQRVRSRGSVSHSGRHAILLPD